jgi:hypothetical protein
MLLAALTLSAATASVASAAGDWYVAGTALGAGATRALATVATIDKNAVLSVPKLSELKVTCTGLEGASPEIVATNEGKAAELKFTNCSVTHPTTCALENQPTTISTVAVKATVATKGTEDRVTFSPAAGETFVSVTFTEKEAVLCALAGTYNVKGSVTVGAPTGQTESTLQAIEGLNLTENSSLALSKGATNNKAYIEGGKALLKLKSEEKWSFHT